MSRQHTMDTLPLQLYHRSTCTGLVYQVKHLEMGVPCSESYHPVVSKVDYH